MLWLSTLTNIGLVRYLLLIQVIYRTNDLTGNANSPAADIIVVLGCSWVDFQFWSIGCHLHHNETICTIMEICNVKWASSHSILILESKWSLYNIVVDKTWIPNIFWKHLCIIRFQTQQSSGSKMAHSILTRTC